jgi:hypothetical protein
MPLFNWDAETGSSVFKPYFKYDWIVTVPLTLIVILIWSVTLLLPWKQWIPWQQNNSGNLVPALDSFLDDDSSSGSRSLVDD